MLGRQQTIHAMTIMNLAYNKLKTIITSTTLEAYCFLPQFFFVCEQQIHKVMDAFSQNLMNLHHMYVGYS